MRAAVALLGLVAVAAQRSKPYSSNPWRRRSNATTYVSQLGSLYSLEQRHDKFDDRALRALKEILPTQDEARLFRESTRGLGPAAESQAQAKAQVWFGYAASRRLTLLDAVNALLFVQHLNRESNKLETNMQLLQDCCNEICSSVALRELLRLVFRTICAGDITVGLGPGPASASLNVLKQLAMVVSGATGDTSDAAAEHLRGAAEALKGNYLAFRQDSGDAAGAALPDLAQLARLLRRPQQQQLLQYEGQARRTRVAPEHSIASELRRLQLDWAAHRAAFQYGGTLPAAGNGTFWYIAWSNRFSQSRRCPGW